MSTQQFTQLVVGNYICNYGIIPSTNNGSDVIECFKISESKYGLYLLDVAGKNNLARNTTKEVQRLILNLALSEQRLLYSTNPEQLVQELNNTLCAVKITKYLTLLYGILDLETNYFSYSIAGHYPNPILLNNKYSQYLFGKGFPLGILPNATFEKFATQLQINDSIILLSDGIIKSFMPQEDMENKNNRLLESVFDTKAKLELLIQKLHLTTTIVDDIIVAIITRKS